MDDKIVQENQSDCPFFSIVIPTFNREKLISISIESIINQTFKDWQLIVIDDGSTDNTADLIQTYMKIDSRIQYIYQINSERSVARNNGISNATGKYVCFLDSDDFYLSHRLEKLHQYLESIQYKVGFFYTAISYQTTTGNIERKELNRDGFSVVDFILQAVIGTPQVIVSKELLILEQFNPSLTIGEDMELWLRLSKHAEIEFIPNQATVVATDHDERSVNFKFANPGIKLLKTFEICFDKDHPGFKSTREIRNKLLSVAYLTIFKYWFYQGKRLKSIYYLLKSILSQVKNEQTKYKMNLIIRLGVFQSFKRIKKII
jgi:glycosyltransferase involved in cell wall biosynthesis